MMKRVVASAVFRGNRGRFRSISKPQMDLNKRPVSRQRSASTMESGPHLSVLTILSFSREISVLPAEFPLLRQVHSWYISLAHHKRVLP